MTEVNSVEELKAAWEKGEREFHTTNKTLLYAAALIAKFKSPSNFPSEGTDCNWSPEHVIQITALVILAAIALYAISKDYNIEADIPNGKIKATKA